MSMRPRKRQLLLIALAFTLALSACSRKPGTAPDAASTAAKSAAQNTMTLDASKLPPLIHFATSEFDASADPCIDLNAHVNARWLAAHPIPNDRSSWGPMEMMEEHSLAVQRQMAEQAAATTDATGIDKIVGDFWATGMDEAKINAAGIEPIKSRLAEIDALSDPASIASYLRTSAARGEGQVFAFGALPDFKDSSVNMAFVVQGGLGLDDKGYYFDKDKRDKLQAYQTHIARLIELAGVPADAAATQATDTIAFETRLARASKSSEEIARDVSLYYNPVTLTDADKLTPNFSWTRFFESQGTALPQTFSLAMPVFEQEFDKMMVDVPVEQWQAYLRAHLLDSAAPYLSAPFVQEDFDFHKRVMTGQQEMSPRWKRVLGAIEDGAGEAMGQLYVKVAFPPESKARMTTLVNNLNTALKARIEKLEWMSDATKQKALAKANAFSTKIGYPDKWRDFSGLKTSRDSFLGNVLSATKFNHDWEMGKIGKPVDKTEWNITPQTVNANYSGLSNEITFPAAILQPPYFDATADDAVNYGGAGAVIGHEITHGYDDQGSRFGPTGNFEDWWSPQDRKAFAARTDKLIKQFNAYEVAPGLHVNGKLTLGENIADLGGLATAYDAMKAATANTPDPMTDGLTRDQRFFLSFGTVWRSAFKPDLVKLIVASDPHAPSQFRSIAAPSNLPAYAAAFSCKPGQPMVRSGEKQVVIW